MKKLIFGNGKVSRIIKKDIDVVLDRAACDITNYEQVFNIIKSTNAEIILNCAAKTNLEYCEYEKKESFESNVLGVLNVLKACAELDKKFVHISSGCLFDGNSTISDEKSIATPAVWYTWTKKWADEIIQSYGYEDYLILRPRQLISKIPHKSNMLTKFAGMTDIPAINEPNSLTCIEDFEEMIDHLIKVKATGIYNCCNTGLATPYEIAIKVKEEINPKLNVTKVSYEKLLASLPNRRVNTILSCEKLIKSGYTPRSATDALDWCAKNYGDKR